VDDFGDRPVIYCVVGYEFAGGCRSASCLLTLEDAAVLSDLGWTVVQDPWGWEALTRWEQIQRALTQKPKWNRW
jgi:hypothetical protein